ncbi:flavin reductase family protein [Aureimonas leprariae]|uniref:Flavin reductase n=1 Tax=Plantimonas leprariae TaxID=2615207 RepID=A0A7V7PLV6_9HYPH|nr:flavin reductase family protein [Aureimonas leprariae]KAB0677519.1 flavin reductase [Aureimonas leprariae]
MTLHSVPAAFRRSGAAAEAVQAPTPARGLGLKQAMRTLAGGVSVVTAGIGDGRTGATVTSAHSLSMEPETMAVSINLASSTWEAIRRHGLFCVNVLRADQRAVADRFAGFGGLKGASRYEGADWHPLVTGALALEGALAAIDCEVEHVIERHSHALVLGTVRAVEVSQGPGLVWVDGRYAELAERSD